MVAYAKANGCVVVTHEKLERDARAKVKIPNACDFLGVQWVNTFDMLRSLGAEFVLSAK